METFVNNCIDILMVLSMVCVICGPVVVFGYFFERCANKNNKVMNFINKFWED